MNGGAPNGTETALFAVAAIIAGNKLQVAPVAIEVGLELLPGLLGLLLLAAAMPESPHFLWSAGRNKEAGEVLVAIAATNRMKVTALALSLPFAAFSLQCTDSCLLFSLLFAVFPRCCLRSFAELLRSLPVIIFHRLLSWCCSCDRSDGADRFGPDARHRRGRGRPLPVRHCLSLAFHCLFTAFHFFCTADPRIFTEFSLPLDRAGQPTRRFTSEVKRPAISYESCQFFPFHSRSLMANRGSFGSAAGVRPAFAELLRQLELEEAADLAECKQLSRDQLYGPAALPAARECATAPFPRC